LIFEIRDLSNDQDDRIIFLLPNCASVPSVIAIQLPAFRSCRPSRSECARPKQSASTRSTSRRLPFGRSASWSPT